MAQICIRLKHLKQLLTHPPPKLAPSANQALSKCLMSKYVCILSNGEGGGGGGGGISICIHVTYVFPPKKHVLSSEYVTQSTTCNILATSVTDLTVIMLAFNKCIHMYLIATKSHS